MCAAPGSKTCQIVEAVNGAAEGDFPSKHATRGRAFTAAWPCLACRIVCPLPPCSLTPCLSFVPLLSRLLSSSILFFALFFSCPALSFFVCRALFFMLLKHDHNTTITQIAHTLSHTTTCAITHIHASHHTRHRYKRSSYTMIKSPLRLHTHFLSCQSFRPTPLLFQRGLLWPTTMMRGAAIFSCTRPNVSTARRL